MRGYIFAPQKKGGGRNFKGRGMVNSNDKIKYLAK